MAPDTRIRLLQEAEFLIRTRGYSAFSYADLAERLAISKASVHHHFPSKEDLIVVLLTEYIERFRDRVALIRQQNAPATARLRAYAKLFLDGFEEGMLPLCGALSAERAALPESLHPQVAGFFQLQIDWLADVIREGVRDGALRDDVSPEPAAMLLLSTLEGGSFVGWALQRTAPVLAAFETALIEMERTAAKSRRTSRKAASD